MHHFRENFIVIIQKSQRSCIRANPLLSASACRKIAILDSVAKKISAVDRRDLDRFPTAALLLDENYLHVPIGLSLVLSNIKFVLSLDRYRHRGRLRAKFVLFSVIDLGKIELLGAAC